MLIRDLTRWLDSLDQEPGLVLQCGADHALCGERRRSRFDKDVRMLRTLIEEDTVSVWDLYQQAEQFHAPQVQYLCLSGQKVEVPDDSPDRFSSWPFICNAWTGIQTPPSLRARNWDEGGIAHFWIEYVPEETRALIASLKKSILLNELTVRFWLDMCDNSDMSDLSNRLAGGGSNGVFYGCGDWLCGNADCKFVNHQKACVSRMW